VVRGICEAGDFEARNERLREWWMMRVVVLSVVINFHILESVHSVIQAEAL